MHTGVLRDVSWTVRGCGISSREAVETKRPTVVFTRLREERSRDQSGSPRIVTLDAVTEEGPRQESRTATGLACLGCLHALQTQRPALLVACRSRLGHGCPVMAGSRRPVPLLR